jgi:hypothetical protein
VTGGGTSGERPSYAPNDNIRPFSNGEEFRAWLNRNCHQDCRHYNPNAESSRHGCPIEVALAKASVSDGTIPAHIGLRGGFLEPGPKGVLIRPDEWDWKCPEFKGRDEPDDRPRRGPRPPEGQLDLLDPRQAPERTPQRA